MPAADNVSWVVNFLLLFSKTYAYHFSGSKAVLASLVDSFVDIISQIVIFVAEWRSRRADPRFPVGQARLETLGVLACELLAGRKSAGRATSSPLCEAGRAPKGAST